jgi:hypothetical protein
MGNIIVGCLHGQKHVGPGVAIRNRERQFNAIDDLLIGFNQESAASSKSFKLLAVNRQRLRGWSARTKLMWAGYLLP